FVGALWGCLVFPVIASFYWRKVTNAAFTVGVLAALVVFLPVRFEWIPLTGAWAIVVETLAIIGVGVVLGIMAFGFFGLRAAVAVGALASAAMV
ncbi:sodium:proline symporter, partial [Xanthomonas citri pv. citri]|nr:sodium:proline symporter [Xanthomonas citri pv. citri]